jgi:hypothetical protein
MSLRERVQKEDDHLFPRLVWTMFPWFPSSKKNPKGHSQLSQDIQKKAQNHPKG